MKIWGLLLILLSGVNSKANDSSFMYKNLQVFTKKLEISFKNDNYSDFVDLMYPKAVSMFGGKMKMIGLIKKTKSEMEADGFTMQLDSVGGVKQMVIAGKEIHCIIPEYFSLINDEGVYKSLAYLLAISSDKGKTWSFLDTAGLKEEKNIKLIFPHFNYALEILPREDLGFSPN
ncbi:unnamed protein product [Rotaria sp. Silwood2]|nr:unnamed protein product [Rotaria sp. Silwood2]CAF4780108.1 unnamed protein product [Rotaria sp. Silwood2]